MNLLILRPTTGFDLDFVLEAEQAADNRAFVSQWEREEHLSGLQIPPTLSKESPLTMAHLIIEREEHLSGLQIPPTLSKESPLTMAHLIIERVVDAKPIGYAIINDLQDVNDNLNLRRIVIVEKGQGYGHTALQIIKKFVFEEKKAHRLWLDVKEHNSRARHLYEAEGFVVEGILRECVKVDNDKYESYVVMAILKKEFLQKV